MHRSTLLVVTTGLLALAACGSNDATPLPTEPPADAAVETPATAPPTEAEAASTPQAEPAAETEAATTPEADADAAQQFPDVIGATAERSGDTWSFDATLSSPYDTPERYADAWRILGPDGTEYGVRVLTHDHAGEQPFTRSLRDVVIPEGVDTVTIEGRDQQYGWGGATFDVALS